MGKRPMKNSFLVVLATTQEATHKKLWYGRRWFKPQPTFLWGSLGASQMVLRGITDHILEIASHLTREIKANVRQATTHHQPSLHQQNCIKVLKVRCTMMVQQPCLLGCFILLIVLWASTSVPFQSFKFWVITGSYHIVWYYLSTYLSSSLAWYYLSEFEFLYHFFIIILWCCHCNLFAWKNLGVECIFPH